MFRGTMQQENPTANIADITLIFCASRLWREMKIVFVLHARRWREQDG
jgi:hypothetical protein